MSININLNDALIASTADRTAKAQALLAEIARRSGDASTCTTHADAVLRQAPDDPAARVLLDKCATTP